MALDRFSPDVRNYIEWVEEQIETSRNGLERPAKTEVETAVLRGYIKAMRANLAHLNGDHEDNDPDS